MPQWVWSADMLEPVRNRPPVAVAAPATPSEKLRTHPVTVRNTTNSKRERAYCRLAVITYVKSIAGAGSISEAYRAFAANATCWEEGIRSGLPLEVTNALTTFNGIPSRNTVFEWIAKEKKEGIDALVPLWKGRTSNKEWRAAAVSIYEQPSKTSIAAVHRHLVEVDGYKVTYDEVRNYINQLGGARGKHGVARLGPKTHHFREKSYTSMHTKSIPPGDVYVADGNRLDAILAHPVTGKPWRPELTLILDLGSRFCPGWRLDEFEGAQSVHETLAETIARWDHQPHTFHTDNGSGYVNKNNDDETVGFLSTLGIRHKKSIPGNAHGKGWVERFFRIIKEDFLKVEFSMFYVGSDMSPDVEKQVFALANSGRIQLPSVSEFAARFNDWLDRKAKRPHPEHPETTPAELWETRKPSPPHMNLGELLRRRVELTVRRARITHGKREYTHEALYECSRRPKTDHVERGIPAQN